MRTRLLAALTLLALALTGCSSIEPDPGEISSAGAPNNTQSSEPAENAGFEAAVNASYQKLYETGMTERVTSAGDRYILSYVPAERFEAGLYNIEFDDVIVVEDELFFTVATAYRAIQDPDTVVEETDAGVSISNEQFGDFTIVIENGLVVSGFDNGGSWEGEFSYEPDAMVTELVADLLAQEQTN